MPLLFACCGRSELDLGQNFLLDSAPIWCEIFLAKLGYLMENCIKSLSLSFIAFVCLSGAERQPHRPVDLNTATRTEFMQLPHIGGRTATRIVEFRTRYGRFHRVEEIMNVKGIGRKTFEMIKPHIRIGREIASEGAVSKQK